MSAESETVLRSRVPAAGRGLSLVDWLARRFRYLDPDAWRDEIAAGRVERNGTPARASDVLQLGDVVAYRPPGREPRANTRIEVLLDEPDFAVVLKPAHLVSHADGAFVQNTFFRVLERHYRERGETPRLALVHRLDRETSGLLVIAKTRAAAPVLQQQFPKGRVDKVYCAVVHGAVPTGELVLDGSIGRDPDSAIAIRRAVRLADDPQALPACTEVTVERRYAAHTLVRAVPRTGRTHQIRVHLTHAGHPLVGDKLYGRSDDQYLAFVRHVKAGGDPAWPGALPTGRHLLHAGEIAFDHPRSGERVRVTAPLPADMTAFLEGLAPSSTT